MPTVYFQALLASGAAETIPGAEGKERAHGAGDPGEQERAETKCFQARERPAVRRAWLLTIVAGTARTSAMSMRHRC